MDEKSLVEAVVNKTDIDQKEVAAVVRSLFEVIGENFKKGEKVVVAEFGSFFVREDKTVQFTPSAKLKNTVS